MTNREFKKEVEKLTGAVIKSGKGENTYTMTGRGECVRVELTLDGYYDTGFYGTKEECYQHIIDTIKGDC